MGLLLPIIIIDAAAKRESAPNNMLGSGAAGAERIGSTELAQYTAVVPAARYLAPPVRLITS
jgi:hypothetical protein